MGEGSFWHVLECWDRERREVIAIKIVRAAMIEFGLLQQLGKQDKGGNW